MYNINTYTESLYIRRPFDIWFTFLKVYGSLLYGIYYANIYGIVINTITNKRKFCRHYGFERYDMADVINEEFIERQVGELR